MSFSSSRNNFFPSYVIFLFVCGVICWVRFFFMVHNRANQIFDQRGHIAKLCLTLLPLLVATLLAISRVDDYLHLWQYVFAGGFLGLVVAFFTYLQFFTFPSGEQGKAIAAKSYRS